MENSGGWNGSLGVSFVYLVCFWISYVGWLGEGWVFGMVVGSLVIAFCMKLGERVEVGVRGGGGLEIYRSIGVWIGI